MRVRDKDTGKVVRISEGKLRAWPGRYAPLPYNKFQKPSDWAASFVSASPETLEKEVTSNGS